MRRNTPLLNFANFRQEIQLLAGFSLNIYIEHLNRSIIAIKHSNHRLMIPLGLLLSMRITKDPEIAKTHDFQRTRNANSFDELRQNLYFSNRKRLQINDPGNTFGNKLKYSEKIENLFKKSPFFLPFFRGYVVVSSPRFLTKTNVTTSGWTIFE